MPYRLFRFGLSGKQPQLRLFTRHDSLEPGYDVVIIGGGDGGLSTGRHLVDSETIEEPPTLG